MANGLAINRDEAQKLMNFRDGIVKDARPPMQVMFSFGGNQLAYNHFIKEENVFVFDAGLIQNLITPGGGVAGATHIVLILGAHEIPDGGLQIEKGDRTVIIVGCREVGGKLKSIKLNEPGVEHPPRRADVTFPPERLIGDEGAIEITML